MQETQEMRVRSLGWGDPLEKEMVTHSSILAWEIPWTEESGKPQSMGLQRAGHDWTIEHTHTISPYLINSLWGWNEGLDKGVHIHKVHSAVSSTQESGLLTLVSIIIIFSFSYSCFDSVIQVFSSSLFCAGDSPGCIAHVSSFSSLPLPSSHRWELREMKQIDGGPPGRRWTPFSKIGQHSFTHLIYFH